MTSLVDGLVSFFSPTHLLVLVALGLLAGQHAKRMRALALAAFSLGAALGSVALAAAVRETPAALVLLAIAATAATAVAAALPLPPFVSYALALMAGIALALNSPPQAVTIPTAVAAQLGTAIAALVALALVTFLTTYAARPWQRIAIRILGSWIAASAILVLALRLAR